MFGGPPTPVPAVGTLVDLLSHRAAETPDAVPYRFLENGESESIALTFGELERRARSLAVELDEAGLRGERVLLLFPSGPDFVGAFFACLCAGAVAVPAYPPRGRRRQPRLEAVFRDAEPAALWTTRSLAPRLSALEMLPEGDRPRVLTLDWSRGPDAAGWRPPPQLGPESIAFLQYTSGSTSSPKGVRVTHRNVLANERMIARVFGQSESSRIVGWLPLFHDMGLIGNLLQPLYAGSTAVLMPPEAFLQRPVRWLEAISRYRADTSGAPNFAYDLCVRRTTDEERMSLDLRSWRIAFNGSEPVRAATLDRFAAAFEPHGFDRRSFLPCYGLAESTLLVCGGGTQEPVARLDARELECGRAVAADPGSTDRFLVGSGSPAAGLDVRIVDPRTGEPLAPGRVGEIRVAGPAVADGYWGRPDETEEVFGSRLSSGEGPFLRTGDLGFERDGQLFVTGRRKDLLIVRGRNHYPQDVEATVAGSHPALEAGAGAAFMVEEEGDQRLVVVHEMEVRGDGDGKDDKADPARLAAVAAGRVAADHGIELTELVLVRRGLLPRTTSGKVRRAECRRLLLGGRLKVIASEVPAGPAAETAGKGLLEDGLPPSALREDELEARLRARLARVLRCDVEAIDPAAPLSELGLDSLTVIELQDELARDLGATLPVQDLLEGPGVADLARALARRPEPDRRPAAERAGGDGRHPQLNHGQRALWFLDQLDRRAGAYHLSFAVRLPSQRALRVLVEAFRRVAVRHPALRSRVAVREGRPFLRVTDDAEVPVAAIPVGDWSEERLRERLGREARRPFDLDREPPLRLHVVRRRGEPAVLLLVLHHLAVDLWSLAVMARELSGAVETQRPEATVPTPAPRDPEALALERFVEREQAYLDGAAGERAWRFWREHLAGELPELDLPLDRRRPPVQSFAGARHVRRLSATVGEGVGRLARRYRTTPFTVAFSAYALWLHRVCGQEAVIVGFPVSVRDTSELTDAVGYFVNTLAIRTTLSADTSGGEFLEQVRDVSRKALDHRRFPFSVLAERLSPVRDPARQPVFQTLFSYPALPAGASPELKALALGIEGARLRLGGLPVENLALDPGSSRFDLSLAVGDVAGGWLASFEYGTELLDQVTVARWAAGLEALFEDWLKQPAANSWDLSLLRPAERHQLLVEWNDRWLDDGFGSVLEGVDRMCARQPDAVAVCGAGAWLTYGELRVRVRALAAYLRRRGAGRESTVGVLLEPSARAVVALLGAMAADAAFVPVDPRWPEARQRQVMTDAGVRLLVVADEETAPSLDGVGVVAPNRGIPSALGSPMPRPEPAQSAYVMFTSGSTGRPKGVVVPHGALSTFLRAMARAVPLRPENIWFAFTPLSFDISILEILLPLLRGARVVFPPPGIRLDGERLAAELAIHRITVAQATPVTWKLLRDAGWPGDRHLRALSGGDVLPRELALDLAAGSSEVLNLYGPTETTIWSSWSRFAPDGPSRRPVSIGRPIAETRMAIADPRLRPVPAGVVGELVIGGAGVARGYHGRPGLTAERFVPDALGGGCGTRVYRTGDLGRARSDGRLEVLGRLDFQVKVRGVRVELGELEAALRSHPQLRDACAAATGEAGERALAAYVVAEEPPAPDLDEIRGFLVPRLPEAVLPTAVVPLKQLPLTPTGKVDRSSLPRPRPGRPAGSRSPAGSDGPVEALVAQVWAEVLGVGSVAPDDRFFDLGGHSLAAARVMMRVRRALGVDLPVSLLFQAPTVRGLSRAIRKRVDPAASRPELRPVLPAAPLSEAPLSRAQKRLWAFETLHPGTPVYAMCAAVRCVGTVDPGGLARALNRPVDRHAALRVSFAEGPAGPRQHAVAAVRVPLPVVDLSALPPALGESTAGELERTLARRPVSLAAPPPLRAALLRPAAAAPVLVLVTHHLVADARSLEIFLRELAETYREAVSGERAEIDPPTLGYLGFAAWEEEAGSEEAAPWRELLAGAQPIDVLTDRPPPAEERFEGAMLERPLSAPLDERLDTFSRTRDVTPFMVLLAAAAAVLARHGGRRDLVIGVPVTGRRWPEVEGLVGLFAELLPCRLQVEEGRSFSGLVRAARDAVLRPESLPPLPVERAGELTAGEGDAAGGAFEVTFSPMEALPEVAAAGLRLIPQVVHTGTSKFDLSLYYRRGSQGWALGAEYRTALRDATTVRRLLDHWREALRAGLSEPATLVDALPPMRPVERSQVLREWNDTAAPEPGWTVRERVIESIRARPDAVAIDAEGSVLSYGELRRRAESLAGLLVRLGVGPETTVAVLAERSAEFVIAAFAVWLTGGAYVPLDPRSPTERVGRMVELCGARALMVDRRREGSLPDDAGVPVVEVQAGGTADGAAGATEGRVLPGNLAYVIFTSGSTGEPKGVEATDRGLANLTAWHLREYPIDTEVRASQVAGLGFDAAVWETWPVLSAGATLVLAPPEIESASSELLAWMVRERITHAFLPTPLAEEAMAEAPPPGLALEVLLTGGDRLRRAPGERFGPVLVNHYGPTESTVVATRSRVPRRPARGGREGAPPIGRPIANTQTVVCDRRLGLSLPGVPGELCIGGAGLARGYAGRPRWTAESFVPHPHATGGRLYRTGDRVRWNAASELDFLGRLDRQVKIRGYRLELGEIEHALAQHPGVRSCAVVLQRAGATGDPRLTAFVVPANGHVATEDLRRFLLSRLPTYMVPALFGEIRSLPLTANGKVDREALRGLSAGVPGELVPPRTDLEETVAALVREVVGASEVGVTHTLFDLGGHSLHVVRLLSRIRDTFEIDLPAQAIFADPTVEGITRAIAGALVVEAGNGPPTGSPILERSGAGGGEREAP